MTIIEFEEELRDALIKVVEKCAHSFGVNVTPERQIEIWDKASKTAADVIYKELTGDDTQADNSDGAETDSR